jgi:hypothetical protein
MDPVTIAAAITATRTLVKSAKGISDIAHGIDDLFHAKEQHAKNAKSKSKKTKPKTRMQQVLRMRSGDESYDDNTSISAVANDVLEQRQIDRDLEILSREIDRKWGRGTWEAITEERDKRVKEREENEKKRKKAAKLRAEEDREFYNKVASWVGQILVVLIAVGGMIWFLVWAANRGAG